jgi:hypothetical protein
MAAMRQVRKIKQIKGLEECQSDVLRAITNGVSM